jgi:hypothetical protein
MTFQVLMVVVKSFFVVWLQTLCGLVGRYKRFGATHCFYLQAEDVGYLPTSPRGVTVTIDFTLNSFEYCVERQTFFFFM